jgi:predicted PurR-regulated permease PerM
VNETSISPTWNTTVKVVVIVFCILALLAIAFYFQGVIAPLVLASLIAYVLMPIVNVVTARTPISRGVATAAIYLLFFGLIALSISLLAPSLVRQMRSFQLDFRRIGISIERLLSQPLQIGSVRLDLDLARFYDDLVATLTDLVTPLATQTMTLLAGVVSIVVEAIFIGIVSFYLTKDGPQMGEWLAGWVPPHLRYDFDQLRKELALLWRAFFRGQILLATTVGLTLGIAMFIVGMRNALILGLLGFLLEFLFSVGHGIWLAIAVLLALFQGHLNMKTLKEVMRSTTMVTSMVFLILIGASIFSLVFRGFGGDDLVASILTDLPGGVFGAMLAVMLVMFLLGFILDFIEITFVVVPIVGPILLAMGLDPIWLGIMIAINLQTSFLTPPFGFALFYLRGVAPPEVATGQIYRGVAPFIVIQLIMMGLLAWQPELATWLPGVVYDS